MILYVLRVVTVALNKCYNEKYVFPVALYSTLIRYSSVFQPLYETKILRDLVTR